MIIPPNIKAVSTQVLLNLMVGSFLLLFNIPLICSAQNTKPDVELKFVKASKDVQPQELYFNVLKIWNNTPQTITGNVVFTGPDNWKIIAFPSERTVLAPGDTVSLPLRVSPAANAVGGIAYIINATFRNSKMQVAASTYLTLPRLVKWDFSVNTKSAYLTENNPNATFQIRLSNKGNTNELVKLRVDAGKLLVFTDNSPNNVLDFITLKAYSDTIISRTVKYQPNVTFAERLRYENNWKESAVQVTASSEQTEKGSAIQISKLGSVYVNQRAQISSPLNVDYQVYNLMSNQGVRHNAKVYGSLLFPKNREIQYFGGIHNYSFSDKSDHFDPNTQIVYNLQYTDNRNDVQLGYNVCSGTLHTINGRGLVGSFRASPRNRISYAVTENPFSKRIGGFLGYSTSFRKLSLNAEFTHENMLNKSYEGNSAVLGASLNFLKHHYISFQFLGSKVDYSGYQMGDTSVLGYSYQLSYNVNYKKLGLRLSSVNSDHNYVSNSGVQQVYLDGRYMFNEKVGMLLYGTHHRYSITRYPYNFFNPINFNTNDNLRLTTSFRVGTLQYQIGPNYTGSVRQFYNSATGYKSEYINYQPGVWCSATYKFGGYRSISPNLTVSNIRFYYKTDDPTVDNFSFDKNIYYSAGLSYFDNVWRVNAYYTSGSSTDLYRSVLTGYEPTISRCLQFRPSYENFYFNRQVKLSASLNYAYYMPSGRENVAFNLKYDHFFKKGWNLSVSGYMFSNTRVDDEKGRISTKDLNVFVGITKSFNIQQPRLKYYDFKSIFFNDLDGNKIKTDNEPPVTDVLVTIEKDKNASAGPANIPEFKLVTDANGSIAVENLPKDNYKLAFDPLLNLQSLYFLNGSEQTYCNDKSRTIYIPLAESYKIKGRIILERDPNSQEGKINVGDIRITATGPKGESYSVLTDNSGSYILSVPNADKYVVHINNVFGQYFSIDASDVEVQFAQSKTVNVDFRFIEQKRGIQFEGGELFKFDSLNSDSTESNEVSDRNPDEEAVDGQRTSTYAIQLASQPAYRQPSYFKNKYKLKEEVLYSESDGIYKYYTGNYKSLKEAKAAMVKLGVQGVAVPVDRSVLKEGKVSPNRQAVVSQPSKDKSGMPVENTQATRPVVYPKSVNPVEATQSEGMQQPNVKGLSTNSGAGTKDNKPAVTRPLPVTDVQQSKPQRVVGNPSAGNPPLVSKPEVVPAKQASAKETSESVKVAPAKTVPVAVIKVDNKASIEADSTYLYTIQLDASRTFREPSYYKQKYGIPYEVILVEKGFERKYYVGKYKTMEAATADIARYGITGFIVPIGDAGITNANVVSPVKK